MADPHPVVALLAAERRRKGITQTACAKAAGVSKTCISEMEGGHHEPRLRTFLAYAATIGYPYPTDLLDPKGSTQ